MLRNLHEKEVHSIQVDEVINISESNLCLKSVTINVTYSSVNLILLKQGNWSVSQGKGPPTHRALAWDFMLQFPSSLFSALHRQSKLIHPSTPEFSTFKKGDKAVLQR